MKFAKCVNRTRCGYKQGTDLSIHTVNFSQDYKSWNGTDLLSQQPVSHIVCLAIDGQALTTVGFETAFNTVHIER